MSARRRYGGAGKNFSPESVTSESKNGPATLWLATSIVLFSSLNSYEDFSNAYDCELISFTDLCLFKAKPRESVQFAPLNCVVCPQKKQKKCWIRDHSECSVSLGALLEKHAQTSTFTENDQSFRTMTISFDGEVTILVAWIVLTACFCVHT